MNESEKPPVDNSPEETPKHEEHKDRQGYEPEYYEPTPAETQSATNAIGWIVALILIALAIWLLWIALK